MYNQTFIPVSYLPDLLQLSEENLKNAIKSGLYLDKDNKVLWDSSLLNKIMFKRESNIQEYNDIFFNVNLPIPNKVDYYLKTLIFLPAIEIIFPSSDRIKRKTLTYTDLIKFVNCGFINWEYIIIDILLSNIDSEKDEIVSDFVIQSVKEINKYRPRTLKQ